jgi:hypothetical protein
MVDLKPVARAVRWGGESLAQQLAFIPEEKLDWKPTPECKSALQVTGEVAGVMRMLMPLFRGEEMQPPQGPLPHPTSLEEAKAMLEEAVDAYAAALEKAGPELERVVPSPFGEMVALQAVLFPMIDLMHHHGQVTYLQCLLGDGENHGDPASVAKWFGPVG